MAVMQQCPVEMNTRWYHFVTNAPESEGLHPVGAEGYIMDHDGVSYLVRARRARKPRSGRRNSVFRKRPLNDASKQVSQRLLRAIMGAMRYAVSWCVSARLVKRHRRGR